MLVGGTEFLAGEDMVAVVVDRGRGGGNRGGVDGREDEGRGAEGLGDDGREDCESEDGGRGEAGRSGEDGREEDGDPRLRTWMNLSDGLWRSSGFSGGGCWSGGILSRDCSEGDLLRECLEAELL